MLYIRATWMAFSQSLLSFKFILMCNTFFIAAINFPFPPPLPSVHSINSIYITIARLASISVFIFRFIEWCSVRWKMFSFPCVCSAPFTISRFVALPLFSIVIMFRAFHPRYIPLYGFILLDPYAYIVCVCAIDVVDDVSILCFFCCFFLIRNSPYYFFYTYNMCVCVCVSMKCVCWFFRMDEMICQHPCHCRIYSIHITL